MSSQSYTASSPQPLARDATTIISEDAHSSQFPRGTFRDTHRDAAPEQRRQWARSGRMFWIYDPSSSSSSQDGRSNASSGGNSTRSETSEGRRARVVSPYGSFFVEEMEFDAPAESDSSRWEGHTPEAIGSDTRRVLHPLRNLPSRSQATMMASLLFGMGPPAAHSRHHPGTVPQQPVHDAATRVAEIPLSPLSLAEILADPSLPCLGARGTSTIPTALAGAALNFIQAKLRRLRHLGGPCWDAANDSERDERRLVEDGRGCPRKDIEVFDEGS